MHEQIAPLLDDSTLRDTFVSSFYRLRASYLATLPPSEISTSTLFVSLNAFRLNTCFPELYRTNLVRSINGLLEESEGIERVPAFITQLARKADTLLVDPGASGIDLGWYCNQALNLSAHTISTPHGERQNASDLIDMLSPDRFSSEQKHMLRRLCV